MAGATPAGAARRSVGRSTKRLPGTVRRMVSDQPLLIVSNRGPLRFMRGADGERVAKRGGGGLVTALSAITGTRPLTWVASALSDEDAEVAAEGVVREEGFELRLVVHDREEYDRYYNVFANPT